MQHIFNIGPWDAFRTNLDASDASAVTKNSKLPGIHNGEADAFRHCYWSCIMTIRMGEAQAKSVGDTHEEYAKNTQPKNEEIMDLHNNEQGRKCGLLSKSKDECNKGCISKLDSGDLWYIDKETNMLKTKMDIFTP